jgi:hypothetical protein
MPSAFAAMQGGGTPPGPLKRTPATSSNRPRASGWIPTIVFHGDDDRTVDARNGIAIVEQATVAGPDHPPLRGNVQTGTALGGRKYGARTMWMAPTGPSSALDCAWSWSRLVGW